MQNYFVIIKSNLRATNSVLGMNIEYELDAQILYDKKDRNDLYKNVIIKFLGKLPKTLSRRLQPGLECVLVLKSVSNNIFICDGAYWYIKEKKFYSFSNDKEIQPPIFWR